MEVPHRQGMESIGPVETQLAAYWMSIIRLFRIIEMEKIWELPLIMSLHQMDFILVLLRYLCNSFFFDSLHFCILIYPSCFYSIWTKNKF